MSTRSSFLAALTLAALASQACAQMAPASRQRPASAPAVTQAPSAAPVTARERPAAARTNVPIDRANQPPTGGVVSSDTQLGALALRSQQDRNSQQVALATAIMQGNNGAKKAAAEGVSDGGRPPDRTPPASKAGTSAAGATSVYHAPAKVDCPQCRKPRELPPGTNAPHP